MDITAIDLFGSLFAGMLGSAIAALVLLSFYGIRTVRRKMKRSTPEPEDVIDNDPEFFAFTAGLIATDLAVDWQPEEVYRLHRLYLRYADEVALLHEQKSISGELTE